MTARTLFGSGRSIFAMLGMAGLLTMLGCANAPTAPKTEPSKPQASKHEPAKKPAAADSETVTAFPFQDASLPLEQRVDDLVGRMTLEEKVSQMQQDAAAIDRLGVPSYHWWNEALHGVARNGVATVFPQAIGLAATWNTDLHRRMADIISTEVRAKHYEAIRQGRRGIYCGLDMWSPNINIFRDPRWGRGQETYGEDPYLTGRFGVAFVKGMQGDDPTYFKAIATPKHFAVHSGSELERHRFDAQISQADLWLTYLPAFEACIREGKAFSIMGAYNRTLGTPCCASKLLLDQILRQQWGFAGYVVSDVDAVEDIYVNHQFADTGERAAALAVQAGCDLNGGKTFAKLVSAVRMGLIDEKEIDKSVKRLMRARFKLGMFDPPAQVAYSQIPYDVNDCQAHDAAARDVARQSIVLLKNDRSALPLRKDLKTVAVIGPNADNIEALWGNYNGTPSHPVTILQGIRNVVEPAGQVIYARGCAHVQEQMDVAEVVPAACLFEDESRAVPGLKGNYYRGLIPGGHLLASRVDRAVDFDFAKRAVRPGDSQQDEFNAIWTGVIIAPDSGDFLLGTSSKDGVRLWVDGKLIVDSWRGGGKRSVAGRVTMEKGKAYPIRLEYFQLKNEGFVQLRWTRPGAWYAQAVDAARQADAVVMVLGLTANHEGEEMPVSYQGFNGGDRTTLDLPNVQEELLEAVCAAGKPVVLVLMSGSALSANGAAARVPAIVQAWYPGQQGGAAVADVLFGDYNPAGRLPVTFYKSVKDLPAFENYNMDGRTYRYFRGEALWPFGHGLSYTKFEYGDLSIASEHPATSANVTVSVKVSNTGSRDGDEVAQLYVSRLDSKLPVPIKALAGFKRVTLAAGQSKTVEFTITPLQLAAVDANGKRITEPGQIKIQVGGSSAGGLTKTIQLQGPAVEPAFSYIEPKVK